MSPRVLPVVVLACACASHASRPTALVPSSPAVAARTSAAAAAPVFELPRLGLRLNSPCDLESMEGDAPGPMHFEGARCELGDQSFSVARYTRGGRERAGDEAMLGLAKQGFKTVTREAPTMLGEFRGVELEGTTSQGRNTWQRVYFVGDGMLVAEVSRNSGPLDRPRAERALDSVSYSSPWSVHSFPEGRLSVLFPDGAVRVGKNVLKGEGYSLAVGVVLGGVEERVFAVYARPLEGDADADQRLEVGKERFIEGGVRVVWEGPVTLEGARGRDFLLQHKDVWVRARMLLTSTQFYFLLASAKNKHALLDTSVTRFLDSLRYYPER